MPTPSPLLQFVTPSRFVGGTLVTFRPNRFDDGLKFVKGRGASFEKFWFLNNLSPFQAVSLSKKAVIEVADSLPYFGIFNSEQATDFRAAKVLKEKYDSIVDILVNAEPDSLEARNLLRRERDSIILEMETLEVKYPKIN